jgi:hypothetical protein
LIYGWRHAAWGGNERVTVVTGVYVSNCETARKRRTGRGHGSRENIGSHVGPLSGPGKTKGEEMRESVKKMKGSMEMKSEREVKGRRGGG